MKHLVFAVPIGTLVDVIQYAVDAVSLGSQYALYALGIALIFGVMKLINFAHGELITAGAFAVYLFSDVAFVPLFAIVVLVVVALALLVERAAFRPIRDANPATLLVASFAVSFLLQSLAALIFGSVPKTVTVLPALSQSFTVASVSIGKLDVATVGSTLVLVVLLALFLTRTKIGLQMRAAAEDFTMARMLGVKANRVIAVAFAISGLLAAVASMLLVIQTGSVTPTMGVTPVLFAFIATIMGGIGSLEGAVLGGFILGILTVVLQVVLPIELRPYRDAFVFGIVLLLLVLRPQGLIVSKTAAVRV